MTKITNDTFLGVTIILEEDHVNAVMDFGAVTLSLGEKEFIVDIVQTYREYVKDTTIITCDVEIDEDDTFPGCKYDIEYYELLSNELKGCVYFQFVDEVGNSLDDSNIILSMTLFVKVGECTKAINLTLD